MSKYRYEEEDLSGTMLGGCILEQRIGRGGMSSVYLARQFQPERRVALKLLWLGQHPFNEENLLLLARFKREANIIANLSHDNIIDIYAYGEEGQYAYLLMPYFKGGSLGDLIERQKTLTIAQTNMYLQQTSAGLDHAHNNGIIHRDLKPENLLLSPDLTRLVIADFGIARMASTQDQHAHPTLTQAGTIFGTYQYMAPENFRQGIIIDYRADIYALGILLYQMLSGELPFAGDAFTVIGQHLHDPLPFLSHSKPDIPFAVDLVLQKATDKNPAFRYTSAGELAREFEQVTRPSPTPNHSLDYRNTPAPIPYYYPSLPPTVQPINVPAKTVWANVPTPDYVALTQKTQAKRRKHAPSSVKKSPHSASGPLVLLCLFVIIVTLLTPVWITYSAQTHLPRASLTATAVASTAQKGEQSIQQFYGDINAHKYKNAYAITDASFQKGDPYNAFVKGYSETQHDDIKLNTPLPISPTKELITVTITALENRPSGQVTNIYVIQYAMLLDHGTWKIDSGKLLSKTHNL